MRRLLVIGFVLVGSVAQAQAPAPMDLAARLKDAQAELTEASKVLLERPEYQRFLRARRNAEGWQALVDAEKANASK